MFDKKLFATVVLGLAANSEKFLEILDKELSLPNIPWKVYDGGIFWTTIAECSGWKVQQNIFTKSARILDSNGIRIAWGTVNGMEKVLDRMLKYMEKYNKKMPDK